MDRNAVIRWAIIAIAVFAFMKWGYPAMSGKSGGSGQAIPAEAYADAPSFKPDAFDVPKAGETKEAPAPEQTCRIRTDRFDATFSSHGAGLTHFRQLDPQYARSAAADLVTTPDVERWRNLRTLFRADGANDQVKFDRFDWKTQQLENACEFTYEDADVRITKIVKAGARPYELSVETHVTNLASEPKKHRFSIAAFAYRTNGDMKGSMGRQSPWVTDLTCARDKDVQRKQAGDFKEGWFSEPLVDKYAAVSSLYFSQVLAPADTTQKPTCDLLNEKWYGQGQQPDDDNAGNVFHAVLDYAPTTLSPNQTAEYHQIAFFGPKERDILAQAAGGRGLGSLIDLGFFTIIAKYIVAFLVWIHAHVTFGNWGLAIIALTLAIRLLLFPLTWKSIQSTIAMRRLKPEIDALNAKFKDDAQAKNLAMMELWRKHKVNPLGGCLPMLVQMPVWFAMYRSLQTAVEMYHEKFLWFSDLSSPDELFFGKFGPLPLILGALMIVQQRIVPQQGMDPMQQKMMTWMMPLVFTGMMLFLPAALGIYMLTNSALAIIQQLALEKFAPRNVPGNASGTPTNNAKKSDIEVRSLKDDESGRAPASFGKGKARV